MAPSRPLGLLDLYSLSRHLARPAPIYANVGLALLLRAAEDNSVSWHDRVAAALPQLVTQYPALLSKITGCRTPQPTWTWIEDEVNVSSVLTVGPSLPDYEPRTVDAEFARQLNDAVTPLDERNPLWRMVISPLADGRDDKTQILLTLTWSHCLTDGLGGTYIIQALLRVLNSPVHATGGDPASKISLSQSQKEDSFPASLEERIDTKASFWKALPYMLPTIWKPSYWAGTTPADASKPPRGILRTRAFPLAHFKSLCAQHGATIHSALEQLAVRTLAECIICREEKNSPPAATSSSSNDSQFLHTHTPVNLRPYCGIDASITSHELGNYVGRYAKHYRTADYYHVSKDTATTTTPPQRDFWADARAYRAEIAAAVPGIITETGLLKYVPIGPQYEAYWKKPLKICPMGRSVSYLTSNVGRLDFSSGGVDIAVVTVDRAVFGQVPGITSAAVIMNVISTADTIYMTLSTQEGCVDATWLDEFWDIWSKNLADLT
ncbi:hypothetical protein HDU87_000069 [Geranomyces variabilis]|uniref:Uncharacterized protein n=1 Tax=Geranomyces variabilis TaxID=109894 RepID=A0AAD5TS01_9FUNG|nr:hypothetical protein HDU87_000069 [Geranomyces variabilis]